MAQRAMPPTSSFDLIQPAAINSLRRQGIKV
jgi:hypothetical protein